MMTGKDRRLRRLLNEDGRTLLVAVDHAMTTGSAGGLHDMRSTLHSVVRGGADGIVMHRGSAVRSMPVQRGSALVVHLSGNTTLSESPEMKTRVCEPEDALALGADAVSCHVTLGCGPREDRDTLHDLGALVGACHRLGLPLLAMTYVRPGASGRDDAAVHAAIVASEMGADIVKASARNVETVAMLAGRVSVPVVVAGGEAVGDWDDFMGTARSFIDQGIAGLCVGRRVFGHSDPTRAVRELRSLIDEPAATAAESASAPRGYEPAVLLAGQL